jgi:hypothetical protein
LTRRELPAEAKLLIGHQDAFGECFREQGQGPIHEHALFREGGWVSVRVARLGTFGHTADPTLDDLVLVLVFLFVLLALAPPARNHSAFVSFFFVADLLPFGWLFFFADFFVFIGYLLGPLCGVMVPPIWEVDHIGGLGAP